MFIFDVIGDMLSALGLVTAGGISVIGIIAYVLFIICSIPLSLLLICTLYDIVWFWTKKGIYKILGKNFPEYVDTPGISWLERVSGMR